MKQTPKEKAAELFRKFKPYSIDHYATWYNADQCVNEIINANPTQANLVPALRGSKLIHESTIEYWQQVKQELQKM